jgi:hypothetical protein
VVSGHSHSIILAHHNTLIWQRKVFANALDHRLTNRQKIALLISKENFASLDFARFRRLSTAIGRFFSVCRRLIDTWSSKKDRREAIYRLVKIEVEVDTRAQLQKALGVDVDAALLDNISPDVLKRGVAMVGGHAIKESPVALCTRPRARSPREHHNSENNGIVRRLPHLGDLLISDLIGCLLG